MTKTKESVSDFADSVTSSSVISDSIPHVVGEYSARDIINEYKLSDDVVSRYESAIKWYYWIKGKPFTSVAGSYLLILILSVILTTQTNIQESTISDIIAGLFFISVAIALVGWILKRIALNRAKNESISREEAIYHRVVSSIESFQDERLDDTRKHLNSVNETLKTDESNAFHPEFTEELSNYLDKVEEKDSEKFLLETFPVVANHLLQYLSVIRNSNLEDIYKEMDEDESTSMNQYTPKSMMTAYLGDWLNKRVVRIIAPFVLVSPVIWMIYSNVSKTIAQISFLAFVAVVQIYHNLNS